VDVRIRSVHDPDDPALLALGALQREVYYEPDALIPGQWLGRMLQWQSGERRNFVVVAEADGKVVGGAVFHYLAAAGSGFSSFMGVARAARGQGIARHMHEARIELLNAAAGGHLQGVFIDVVNPTRMSHEELAREESVGSDPWLRRRIFGRLGFRQVDVRYEQPVGGPNGGPVTNLDLLYCPSTPAESVSTQLVSNTMRAYWTPWLGVDRAQLEAQKLEQRANGQSTIALLWPEPARELS
jgi:GNAT superfamily N-acetyltransferase